MKITTDRLLLRNLSPADAESFYLLNEDPEVLKYTGDLPFTDSTAAKEFLENYDHYQKYGFGRWAVIRIEDNEFLGWCGIKYTPETKEHDIGFRFFKQFWGNGYATESAKTCIEYGFNTLKIKTIIGRAMKSNDRSIKVLEKIGLIYDCDFDFDGEPGVIYKIENNSLY